MRARAVGFLFLLAASGPVAAQNPVQDLRRQCSSEPFQVGHPGSTGAEICRQFDDGGYVTAASGNTCYVCPAEDFVAAAPAPVGGMARYLSDLKPIRSGRLAQGVRNDDCWEFNGIRGQDLRFDGTTHQYTKGVGLHPLNSSSPGYAVYEVPDGAQWFVADVGFCSEWRSPPDDICRQQPDREANFAAYTDARVGRMMPVRRQGSQRVKIPVSGAGTLTLEVDHGERFHCDWVLFADARFE